MNTGDGFTVITSISRNTFIDRFINNFLTQEFKVKELIIVINNDEIEIKDFDKYTIENKNISVYKLPQSVNLGECMNFGVSKSKFNYVAKFDDDDIYSPCYLNEMYNALIEKNCDVVGKSNFYFYLAGSQALIEYPKKGVSDYTYHRANDYVTWIPGATICFRKKIFDIVRFADINSCIDNVFMEACEANNIRAYSTSNCNFMAFRNVNKDNHTWKVNDKELMSRCDIIEENISIEDAYKIITKEIEISNSMLRKDHQHGEE